MARRPRDPVEIASDIGAKAFDLMQHGDVAACRALWTVARVNPEMLAWLRDRLLDITQQRPVPVRPSQPHTCHDMNPPFPGPCAACQREQAEGVER